MPIYARKCPNCGGSKEIFLHMSQRDSEVICEECHIVMKKVVTAPAKTATLWNDGWNAGLSGQGIFSKALGRNVANKREEEKILAKAGFVSESELGTHFFEDKMQEKMQKEAAQDALTAEYNSKIAEYGGDKVRAMTETFTPERCLSGELDKVYDDKITI